MIIYYAWSLWAHSVKFNNYHTSIFVITVLCTTVAPRILMLKVKFHPILRPHPPSTLSSGAEPISFYLSKLALNLTGAHAWLLCSTIPRLLTIKSQEIFSTWAAHQGYRRGHNYRRQLDLKDNVILLLLLNHSSERVTLK